MAVATKVTITLTLFSLLFLVIYLSRIDQIHDLQSITNLPLSSISSRSLQHVEALPMIKENDIILANIEQQLARARSRILKATVEKTFALNQTNESFISDGSIYRNPFAFL
ncbi:hypothetical protein Tco_1433175, partial [Tanacetum coccineum]